MAKRNNNNTEAKIVNFDEAQKAVKEEVKAEAVKDESPVSSEPKTEETTRLRMDKLIDEIKDMQTVREILNYFMAHKVVVRRFVDFKTAYAAARAVIDQTQYDDEGRFVRDLPSMSVHAAVATFYLFTDIDFGDMSVAEAYDAITQYNLMAIVEGAAGATFGSGNVMKYCNALLEDIDYNNRSMFALVSTLITELGDAIGNVASGQPEEDAVKAVAGQLADELRNVSPQNVEK